MLVSRIRRLRWGWQLALWPLYGAVWIIVHIALVVLRVAVVMKRIPLPQLLLIAVAVAAAALVLGFGNAIAAQILGPIVKVWLVLAVAYFVARTIFNSLRH